MGARRRSMALVAAVAATSALGAGCRSEPAAAPTAALELLMSGPSPAADDAIEVWVCHIPPDTTEALYVPDGARLTLTPAGLAATLRRHVTAYFVTLSGGAYRPAFVAGGEVTIAPDDPYQACIDHALDGSGDAADAVLVVADAEHQGNRSGGEAQPGTGCECPARVSRRFAYVGASDFAPAWGPVPALDLTEHELGHTLGLPHSGDAPSTAAAHLYTSALDVMSNSAAPRDVDPGRRDAQGTIAANLLALGWLPLAAVAVVPPEGGEVALRPSAVTSRPAGTRHGWRGHAVAVVPLDPLRLLTIELLAPTGLSDHLPIAGIAVHLVDQSPAACGHTDGTPCVALERAQTVLGSEAPHTDVHTAGESLEVEGWRIEVRRVAADGSSATVALRSTDR